MALVKVRNINTYPFSQKFRGKMISIEPGEYVEMDEEDAPLFLGQFSPFKKDNKGNDDPKFFKMLKIERDSKAVVKDPIVDKYMCPVCREQTSSWTELEAHQRLMHSDQLVRDAEYEKYLAQKAKDNGAKAAGAGAPKG